MDDIVVNGVTYNGVEAVAMQNTSGRQVAFYDLTGDTVSAETLLSGYTAHDAAGNLITGTAKAAPTGHLVVFMGNGGTSDVFYAYTDASGKLTELPTATRDGYTLLGWYTAASGGTQITTDTVFTEDTILYAQWKQNTVTVTVTGYGSTSYCYVIINGTNVVNAGTHQVIPGDTIGCYASNRYVGLQGAIRLNGTTVVYEYPASYTYTVTKNATIKLESYTSAATGDYTMYRISITDQ